jgi:DNA-binding transcriptional LysR family regulator
MTLNQLKVFDAVCRHLSFTRASETLHISEPSVFHQAKAVEQASGTTLYAKAGRGIALTHEGRLFHARVSEILAKLDRLEHMFKPASNGAAKGSLIVGGSYGLSASFLPLLVAVFKETHAQTHVLLRSRSSREIERLLLASQIEIAVITRPSTSPVFHVAPYRKEKLVAFVSTKHPLASRSHLSPADVARGPLIVRQGHEAKTWEIFKRVEAQGHELNILMECESSEAVKSAVSKGLGVGVLYRDHIESELKSGKLKILKLVGLSKVEINSYVVYRKDKVLSQNATDFLALLWERQKKKVSRPKRLEHEYPVLPPTADPFSIRQSPAAGII